MPEPDMELIKLQHTYSSEADTDNRDKPLVAVNCEVCGKPMVTDFHRHGMANNAWSDSYYRWYCGSCETYSTWKRHRQYYITVSPKVELKQRWQEAQERKRNAE